jgi:uncharacterized protein YqfB (UPF0267 family)
MHHDLKIQPCYFEAVLNGDKTFEIRNNADRGFQKGDTVTLKEIGSEGKFTGREIDVTITYVCSYEQQKDYVVFSFIVTSIKAIYKQKGYWSDFQCPKCSSTFFGSTREPDGSVIRICHGHGCDYKNHEKYDFKHFNKFSMNPPGELGTITMEQR